MQNADEFFLQIEEKKMRNCMPDLKKLSNKVIQFSYLFNFFPVKKGEVEDE